ncbi:carboxymuconolactone decarboxylase family protein [Pontibacter sp. G13]|uniref:carboxymuconolactone decarboxylase family protein n=1 Tax=Pontibacter sp. G13 TaxID=3074898 RepID=UPI002889AE86|nr:carboxymuconolactone decarboxylase family protein [Pontibacter sp. G13]WNJ17003.1 carboxymuconolactone decarboxylase family protein [Pontibacter sp. G13]
MMANFTVPTRDQVTPSNQEIFDTLKSKLGMVPNLYATFAHSETALGNFLGFGAGKTSLTGQEQEAVNLIVSQLNGCRYCQSAHTMLAKGQGLSEDQILEIRGGGASFDAKLDALVKLAGNIVERRGKADQALVDAFLAAGYTEGSLVDLVLAVNKISITNYLHNLTQVPIDFPVAPELEKTIA